jgi:hypothetical protein
MDNIPVSAGGYNGRIEYAGRAEYLAYGDRIPQASEQSERIMHVTQWLQRWITTRRRTRRSRYLCMVSVERLLLLLGALLLLGLWQASHAEHTASLRWMRGYRSADGVGCCSEHDCVPWPVALLQISGDEATVLLGDTVLQLPTKSVHATQDGQTYWCCQTNTAGRCPDVPTRATTRCVFYTVGM